MVESTEKENKKLELYNPRTTLSINTKKEELIQTDNNLLSIYSIFVSFLVPFWKSFRMSFRFIWFESTALCLCMFVCVKHNSCPVFHVVHVFSFSQTDRALEDVNHRRDFEETGRIEMCRYHKHSHVLYN